MKLKRMLRLLMCLIVGLVLVGALLAAIAMFPGHLEGQYRGVGGSCACDSINFMQFRNGRMLRYSSSHPPADLMGRYSNNADGPVDIYLAPYKEGQAEKLICRAYPHLWATKFMWISDGTVQWGIKYPKVFTVGRTIAEHPICSTFLNPDQTVTKTYYDQSLEIVRKEQIEPLKHKMPGPGPGAQPAVKPDSR